ncbi:MAG TPA: hypothetical protein VLF21_00330 [Candidatus Saccharimonadales bacterium]|nr:hypothetical protein [Candidatus Saccharimonadales bacterium]
MKLWLPTVPHDVEPEELDRRIADHYHNAQAIGEDNDSEETEDQLLPEAPWARWHVIGKTVVVG